MICAHIFCRNGTEANASLRRLGSLCGEHPANRTRPPPRSPLPRSRPDPAESENSTFPTGVRSTAAFAHGRRARSAITDDPLRAAMSFSRTVSRDSSVRHPPQPGTSSIRSIPGPCLHGRSVELPGRGAAVDRGAGSPMLQPSCPPPAADHSGSRGSFWTVHSRMSGPERAVKARGRESGRGPRAARRAGAFWLGDSARPHVRPGTDLRDKVSERAACIAHRGMRHAAWTLAGAALCTPLRAPVPTWFNHALRCSWTERHFDD